MVLKYPGFMAFIGYIAIGFGAIIGIITGSHLVKTTGDKLVPYIILFFVVLGLPLVLIVRCIRIVVMDEKILYIGITKKVKEIRWDEIRKVTFSKTVELILRSEETKIKLHMDLVGFESFLELMKQKLDPSLYEKALQDWEAAMKSFGRR